MALLPMVVHFSDERAHLLGFGGRLGLHGEPKAQHSQQGKKAGGFHIHKLLLFLLPTKLEKKNSYIGIISKKIFVLLST
jgi:hypothetical protein